MLVQKHNKLKSERDWLKEKGQQKFENNTCTTTTVKQVLNS